MTDVLVMMVMMITMMTLLAEAHDYGRATEPAIEVEKQASQRLTTSTNLLSQRRTTISILKRPKMRGIAMSTLPEEKAKGIKTIKSASKIGMKRMRLRRGITVDSGASANVMPRRMVRKQRIRPSPGSRRGAHYLAANNGRIANEGECDFKFKTVEGHEQNLTFQIAEANKALG